MRQFVLIIDDSLTVRRILEVTLKRAGYAYASFPDALEALSALRREPDCIPAAIILDVGLPKMDGYAVIRFLRTNPSMAHASGVRILVLSRYDRTIDRLKARLAGANAYITKPFKTENVLTCLAQLCGSQEAAGTPPAPPSVGSQLERETPPRSNGTSVPGLASRSAGRATNERDATSGRETTSPSLACSSAEPGGALLVCPKKHTLWRRCVLLPLGQEPSGIARNKARP